jgi:DNA-binding NarL/FixJ family response regulator
VRAVLAAAGHRVSTARRVGVAGLSEREIEVLRLLARGRTNRAMAQALTISERTVDHHIRHIYAKLGVSTRAAATLFAMQHHLVGEEPPAE